MTESGFPFRRDHPLGRILDDPFALYEPCDCPSGGHPIEDPTTINERNTTQ
jgi:hypothetical protein